MLVAAATAFLASRGPGFAIVGVLLPTLVHVSLFTLVFMTLCARAAPRNSAWWLPISQRSR